MNTTIIFVLLGSLFSGVTVFLVLKSIGNKAIGNANTEAQKVINNAEEKAQDSFKSTHSDAQDIQKKSRHNMEDEIKSRRQAIADVEDRVLRKERNINEKENRVNQKEDNANAELERVKQLKKRHEAMIVELSDKLEKSAGFSKEEAKQIIFTNVEREVRSRAGKMIKDTEEQARKIASRRAKEIIAQAIQRTSMENVAEVTTSTVDLPDDELKGRIIGKEGRNIRAFESITGVDVIIDDTPGAVVFVSV